MITCRSKSYRIYTEVIGFLDPYPDPDSMNLDPQLWYRPKKFITRESERENLKTNLLQTGDGGLQEPNVVCVIAVLDHLLEEQRVLHQPRPGHICSTQHLNWDQSISASSVGDPDPDPLVRGTWPPCLRSSGYFTSRDQGTSAAHTI